MRARVLHVISHLDLGGAEEVAISLTEQFGGEHAFEFFAVGGIADNPVAQAMHARLSALGVPVHVGTSLDMKRGGLLHAGLKLAALLRRRRPDLVHLHTEIPETTYALAALASRLGGGSRPLVVRTIHNSTLWPAWRRIGSWVEGQLGGAEVVAVSQGGLRGLHEFRAQNGLPPLPESRCQVVYNGVKLAAPNALDRREGAEVGLRVLFAGRLEPQKGADLLPALLERACQLANGAAQVTILGKGSLALHLQRWSGETRLPWPVTLAPPQPGLSGALAGYDVVLMPSRFEGLPLLAAEALLVGTPVIGTDIPGLREVVPPTYPLLAPAGDVEALARLLADVVDAPARYQELARGLRGEIERRFGLPQMLCGYRRIYRELLRVPGKEASHERPCGA
ncbi:MAG: glycosyltransferase [Deinococcota bacterium]